MSTLEPVMQTLDQRCATLDYVLYQYGRGGRIESRGATWATVVWSTQPTHILHIILSVLTFGAWLIIYAVAAAMSRTVRKTYYVDEYGRLLVNGQYVPNR